MSNQWVIGCTHFDDPTVIPFRKNRFKTLEDMQEKICSSWNAKVDDNDPVYILGDFALKRIDYWVRKLKGQKILILGNHDKIIVHSGYFVSVEPMIYLRLPPKGTMEKPQEVFMFHYPCISWENKQEGSVHLHAHSHGNLSTSLPGVPGPARLDMSVDCWDEWPVPLETAIQKALEKPTINPLIGM